MFCYYEESHCWLLNAQVGHKHIILLMSFKQMIYRTLRAKNKNIRRAIPCKRHYSSIKISYMLGQIFSYWQIAFQIMILFTHLLVILVPRIVEREVIGIFWCFKQKIYGYIYWYVHVILWVYSFCQFFMEIVVRQLTDWQFKRAFDFCICQFSNLSFCISPLAIYQN